MCPCRFSKKIFDSHAMATWWGLKNNTSWWKYWDNGIIMKFGNRLYIYIYIYIYNDILKYKNEY